MNEKRFELLLPNAIINDTIVRKSYYLSEKDDVEKLVGVLNEQQATINNFEKLFSETIGVADTSKLLETGDYEIKRMVVKELIENLQKENEQLKHWNKCLAEKRHNEKESNENSIKKLIGKIDFLERIIDGDL